MWNEWIDALRAQLGNQIVAGGIALGLVGVAVAALRKLPGAIWSQAKRLFIVTATLDSRNDLFAAFTAWLNDQRFGHKSRLFMVIQAPPAVADEPPDTADDTPPLQYSPAPGFHLFWYRRRLMWMRREISMNLQVVETVHLGALFAGRRHMEELLEGVVRHAGERRANKLALYTMDRWGNEWHLADTKPRRSLDSVVLDEGVSQRLHDDIHEFFARREWYEKLGIPWRRGYLLHGPPGTGKTSVAYALAGELRLRLCTISLTNPKLNDNNLADLLQRTPPRSLILIEDIDAFFNARQKQDARIAVDFSGLLNAIDGVGAQEGRIVVLTTNHRELLDPALIRPGRIDVEVELGNATGAQLRGFLLRFFPQAQDQAERLARDYPAKRLSPAQIQQILIAADSIDAADRALRAAWQA
ncbi:MAG: AAA family ATPase [Burkholderiaceae bacterium]|jgi:chaperone BCS1|nr:AAA family ATPase [Pseudomonadota bacterium]MBS0597442.1 AAA family ATPase [Pseudomonadota bacterium]MCO5115693.1 AAA family ATPase [Burkholderiaceae bacterium]MCP5218624.1 AAA family ATPase [Burkholderiaceae bacterium]